MALELAETQAIPPKRSSPPLKGVFACTLLITIVFFALLLTLVTLRHSLSNQLIIIFIIDFLFFLLILLYHYLYLKLDNPRRKLLFALWMPFCNFLFILSLVTVNYPSKGTIIIIRQMSDTVQLTVNISALILFNIWNGSSLYLARGEQMRQKFNSRGKLTLFALLNLLTTPLGVVVGIVYETFNSRWRYPTLLSVSALGVLWASVYLTGLFFCLQKDSLLVYSKGCFACFIKEKEVRNHIMF